MVNFVLVGSVDHGKSTCAGRILVDTGTVDEGAVRAAQRDAAANKMDSWWLAYLLDEHEEERLNGKTHEYNILPIHRDDGQEPMNLIDVPGHSQFVTEMILGASMADVVVLVCSARTGEFEKGLKGQLFEHLILSKCMGINNLIVAINKMDLAYSSTPHPIESDRRSPSSVDFVSWSQEVFDKITAEVSVIIKRLQYKQVHFVGMSALDGTNVVARRNSDEPSLWDIITTSKWIPKNVVPAQVRKCFRAKCMFMNIENILTSGYTAVIHSGIFKGDCEISAIYAKKPFITAKDTGFIDVQITLPEEAKLESYVILRNNDATIAIGRIIQ